MGLNVISVLNCQLTLQAIQNPTDTEHYTPRSFAQDVFSIKKPKQANMAQISSSWGINSYHKRIVPKEKYWPKAEECWRQQPRLKSPEHTSVFNIPHKDPSPFQCYTRPVYLYAITWSETYASQQKYFYGCLIGSILFAILKRKWSHELSRWIVPHRIGVPISFFLFVNIILSVRVWNW